MKLNNLKKTFAVSAFGLAAILGTGEIANAQNNRQIQRPQQRVINQQQQRIINQQQQQQRLQNQRYRVNRNGRYYQLDNRGAELLRQAVNRGYQQGFQAGQTDRRNRRASNWGISPVYRAGNFGYQRHVDAGLYQHYFRQGFERGYQDGFNSRYQYGTNQNGGLNILGSILQSILNIQQY